MFIHWFHFERIGFVNALRCILKIRLDCYYSGNLCNFLFVRYFLMQNLTLCHWPMDYFDPAVSLRPYPKLTKLTITKSKIKEIVGEFPEFMHNLKVNSIGNKHSILSLRHLITIWIYLYYLYIEYMWHILNVYTFIMRF